VIRFGRLLVDVGCHDVPANFSFSGNPSVAAILRHFFCFTRATDKRLGRFAYFNHIINQKFISEALQSLYTNMGKMGRHYVPENDSEKGEF